MVGFCSLWLCPLNFASDLAFNFFFFKLMSRAAVAGEPRVVVKVAFMFQFGQEAGIISKLW